MSTRRAFLRGAGAALASSPIVAQDIAGSRLAFVGAVSGAMRPPQGAPAAVEFVTEPERLLRRALRFEDERHWRRWNRRQPVLVREVLSMRSWSPAFAEIVIQRESERAHRESRSIRRRLEKITGDFWTAPEEDDEGPQSP